MGEFYAEIQIPLDDDGFIELECDYCKNRFMLYSETFKDEKNYYFFCPVCGLPNDLNTFYCTEVLEKAKEIAIDYSLKEIQRILGGTVNSLNKSGFLNVKLDITKEKDCVELYEPLNEYSIAHMNCCNIDIKVNDLDLEIGIYCPVCGGEKYE